MHYIKWGVCMSEKKSKVERRTIKLPVYEAEKLVKYIHTVSEHYHFDAERLLTYIMADWVYTFELALVDANKKSDNTDVFLSYLETAASRYENFKKVMEGLEDDKER